MLFLRACHLSYEGVAVTFWRISQLFHADFEKLLRLLLQAAERS
jgi:hypothetical protein